MFCLFILILYIIYLYLHDVPIYTVLLLVYIIVQKYLSILNFKQSKRLIIGFLLCCIFFLTLKEIEIIICFVQHRYLLYSIV